MPDTTLPTIATHTSPMLNELTTALGISRDLIASDDEIAEVWENLPRFIDRIPAADRHELIARMCIAVSAGLFDAAINYAWNSSIIKLRQRIRDFGVNVVPQLIGKPFSEDDLQDLKDSELLDLSLKLNLLAEDSYLLLDQCRTLRNKFSAAHPPLGIIDDTEFLNFLNRCTKYALSESELPRGVDSSAFLNSIKGDLFSEDQIGEWTQRILNTHDAQRELLATSLHGIYCDPDSQQDARANALALSVRIADEMNASAMSELVNRHSDYIATGDTERRSASRTFFEKIGKSSLLNESEKHAVISSVCKLLMQTHLGMNNFYNEPPFAERLATLSSQTGVPKTCRQEFVEVVACCAIGNGHGVSNAAMPFYKRMIQNFSPAEIAELFKLIEGQNRLGRRVHNDYQCKQNFEKLVGLLDPEAVPTRVKASYSRAMKSK